MATILRDDRGQLVRHGYGYYYLADDFGVPASGGWFDRAEAEAAFGAAGEPDSWSEADVALDGRGNPTDADDRFARVQWDHENDGVDDEAGYDFPEALRSLLRESAEEWDDQVWALAEPDGPEAIWIPADEARRLRSACEALPGWGDGPANAPDPLLFYDPED